MGRTSQEPNHEDTATLRDFGFVWVALLIALALLFGEFDMQMRIALGTALGLAVISLLFPAVLRLPYRVWMFIRAKLSWVMTRFLLLLLYTVVLVPLALLRRLISGFFQSKSARASYWYVREEDI